MNEENNDKQQQPREGREPRKVRKDIPPEVAAVLSALGLSGAGVLIVGKSGALEGALHKDAAGDGGGDDEPCDCAMCALGENDMTYRNGVRVITPAALEAIRAGGDRESRGGEFAFSPVEIDLANAMFAEDYDVFTGTLLGLTSAFDFKEEHADKRDVFYGRMRQAFPREWAVVEIVLDAKRWSEVMERFKAFDAVTRVRARRAKGK